MPMKDREDLKELICKPHCRFYRPGEKEELSCQGYEFIKERLDPEEAAPLLGPLSESTPPARFEHAPRIEAVLCARCAFREEDCDFMGGENLEDAVPCGGYVLIARLIETGSDLAKEWLDG